MNEKDFSRIPAGACVLTVGEFELGDNGAGAKSAPVRLVARSGKPIEHWFWGRIVHDLAGMHMSKPRIPIDYVHDSKEILGYLNRFDSSSGDLVTSGALVPFKESDRATEIMHKMREGVPYEASINFGGDGILLEDLPDGMIATVNGTQLTGPAVIVREWPLRGVAICPYGADANTESSALAGNNAKTYSAAVCSAPKVKTEETAMKTAQPVEVLAQAETPKAEPVPATETVPTVPAVLTETPAPVEVPAAEVTPVVSALAVEAAQTEGSATPETQPEPKAELSRTEFLQIVDEFGADIAAQTVKDGGNYVAALKLAYAASKAQTKDLQAQVAQFSQHATGTPARVIAATDPKKSKLFNTGK